MGDTTRETPDPAAGTTGNAAGETPRMAMLRHMHGVAAGYHQHYSTVRTTATSLVLPLGVLASMQFLTLCKDGRLSPWWGILLVVLVSLVVIWLNLIFTRWSRIARRCERFYEEDMATPAEQGLPVGFRHRFAALQGGSNAPRSRSSWLGTMDGGNWADPFLRWAFWALAAYSVGYGVLAHQVCRAGPLPG